MSDEIAEQQPDSIPAAIPATNAAEDPTGTVRIHFHDNPKNPDARRRIVVDASDYCGPYEGCRWQRLTGVDNDHLGSDPVHSDSVAGWPIQPLAEVALVLGHPKARMPVDLAVLYGYELGQHDNATPPVDAELDVSALADACDDLVRAYHARDSDTVPPAVIEAVRVALGRPAEPTVDGDPQSDGRILHTESTAFKAWHKAVSDHVDRLARELAEAREEQADYRARLFNLDKSWAELACERDAERESRMDWAAEALRLDAELERERDLKAQVLDTDTLAITALNGRIDQLTRERDEAAKKMLAVHSVGTKFLGHVRDAARQYNELLESTPDEMLAAALADLPARQAVLADIVARVVLHEGRDNAIHSGAAQGCPLCVSMAPPAVGSEACPVPGVIDGDVVRDLLAEMAPSEWTDDAAGAYAEKVLAEMHRVGVTVLRGPKSEPWTPPTIPAAVIAGVLLHEGRDNAVHSGIAEGCPLCVSMTAPAVDSDITAETHDA